MTKEKDGNNELVKVSRIPAKSNNPMTTIMDNFNNFEEGSRSFQYNENKLTKTFSITGKRDGEYETITIEEGLGETITYTRMPVVDKKSDYREEAQRLYHKEGLRQKEIAKRLDISQSSVSRYIQKNP